MTSQKIHHLVALLFLLLTQQLSAQESDLRDDVLVALRQETNELIRGYIEKNGEGGEPKNDNFDLSLTINFSSEPQKLQEEAGEVAPVPLIKGVLTQVRLKFKPKDPAFDWHLQSAVKTFLKRRCSEQNLILIDPHQEISVKVTIDNAKYSITEEFRRSILLLIICLSLVSVVGLLGYLPRRRHIPAQLPTPRSPEASLLEKVTHVRRHPTLAFQSYMESIERTPLSPDGGSWNIAAIPGLGANQLQRVFKSLPLNDAITVMRSLPQPMRESVARRLDLHDAVKKQLT